MCNDSFSAVCLCVCVCVCVHYLQACLSVIQPIEWQEELVLQPAGRDYYGWLIYKVISTHWCRRPRSAHNAAARVLEAALGLCVILFFFCRASSLNSCGPRRRRRRSCFSWQSHNAALDTGNASCVCIQITIVMFISLFCHCDGDNFNVEGSVETEALSVSFPT